jgi:taurine---2-oxoglutarate transaminase
MNKQMKYKNDVYRYDREHVLHSWSIQGKLDPLVVDKAEGIYFWDSSGKRYTDMASQLVNSNIGHQHPKVVRAIKEQAEKLCYISPSFANSERSNLAKMISEITPENIKKCFFTNAGAEANENAIKIARMVTGKWKIISRYRSYHGATYGAIALTGDPRRPPVEPAMPGVVRVFDPYCYRCSFGKEQDSCKMECAKHIEEVIQYENPSTIAAVIIEPITGSNGVFIPPEGYMRTVREICDKYDILLIADEVMSGFGRTGEWFGVDIFNVQPDIMTMAKGINSGYVPLGAVAVSGEIAEMINDKFLYCGLTYSGHPLACSAAVATIKAYREENLIVNSREMGVVMGRLMQKLKKKHQCIGDVRNQGLFGCMELVKNRDTKEPIVPWNGNGEVMDRVRSFLMDRGVYMYLRWNYMFVAPPIIINEDQLNSSFEVIDEALSVADEYVLG